jgi:hypothetical protein
VWAGKLRPGEEAGVGSRLSSAFPMADAPPNSKPPNVRESQMMGSTLWSGTSRNGKQYLIQGVAGVGWASPSLHPDY